MTLFLLLDAEGRTLRSESKQFNHKRFSMRAAAQQKFLDSLWLPGAAEARLVEEYHKDGEGLCFRFDAARRSQHYFPSTNLKQ